MARTLKQLSIVAVFAWFVQPATADNSVGQIQGVTYAVSEKGLGFFQAGETQWTVRCSDKECEAQSSNIRLVVNSEGVSVYSDLAGHLSVWDNRTSQPLPRGRTLQVFERATLLSSDNLVLTDPDAASIPKPFRLSISGINVVVPFMEMWQGSEVSETPTSYLALTDGQNNAEPAQHVPFTKPQIEFAIRSQTDPL